MEGVCLSMIDLEQEYELLIAGGGMAGVAAAITASRCGIKTLLLERRNCSGWEITRSRRIYTSLVGSNISRELKDRLSDINGYRNGILDPAKVEMLLDQMLIGDNVDILFHCWPNAILRHGGNISGALFATSSGLLPVKSEIVIDCTHKGIFARKSGYCISKQNSHNICQSILLKDTPLKECYEIIDNLPEKVIKLEVRPTLYEKEAHLDILLKNKQKKNHNGFNDIVLDNYISLVLNLLKQENDVFKESKVAHIAYESWSLPPQLDIHVQRNKKSNLILAGAYRPDFKASMEENDEISALISIGEEASSTL